MQKFFPILKKCPLFEEIGEAELLRLLGCLGAKVLSFDKKYTVFAEGSPARYIGIVLSGSVQEVKVDYYGNRSILSNFVAGDVFAETFACAGLGTIPVSVIANEPCEIMLINCDHILRTCTNNCSFHNQLIYNLMRDLARKTIQFHQRVEITSRRSTREKLLAYLAQCAQEAGGRYFDIPFDRQELADYLQVDRSGLSVEIGKLKREGVLDNEKNRFKLL